MHTMNRRTFLKGAAAGVGALMLPQTALAVRNLPAAGDIAFRFAVAGDLHYAIGDYTEHAENMVRWFNEEREDRGLDLVFLNGDIVHDVTDRYDELIENYLTRLEMPYYATKGNHDFLEDDQSWEGIWGYPADHVVEEGDMAFVFADTSRHDDRSNHYSAADSVWMEETLAGLAGKEHVFVVLHIAQRMEGVKVDNHIWPRYGVGHQDPARAEEGERVMQSLENAPNVKAVFHGHNHYEAGLYLSKGKPFFFCSRIGHTFGNAIGYRIVEIYGDGTAATYQYDPNSGRMVTNHEIPL